MNQGTALVPVSIEQYPVLVNAAEVAECIAMNLGGEQVSPRDLNRIKVPGSGGTIWTVIGEDGTEEAIKDLEGIIVYVKHKERARWDPNAALGSAPPLCRSSDCVHGVGDPGGDCAGCQYDQFGTAMKNGVPGAGKACGEFKNIFFLRPRQALPDLIKVPVKSLGGFTTYLLKLTSPYFGLVTRLSLVKDKSKSGADYAKIVPKTIGKLSKDESDAIRKYAEAMRSVFEAIEDDDPVNGNGETREF